MKELSTEIEIRASAATVWRILTDFEHFPEWNPFLRRAEGKLAKGGRLKVYMKPSGSFGMTMKPMVIKLEPQRELRWLGHLFVPGLFDGEHAFIIEALGPGRVRFIQCETFKGILVPLFARMLDTSTRRGFREMNEALKVQAEHSGLGYGIAYVFSRGKSKKERNKYWLICSIIVSLVLLFSEISTKSNEVSNRGEERKRIKSYAKLFQI